MSTRLRATMRRFTAVPKFAKQSGAVVGKMKNCAGLPNPPVAYALAQTHIDELVVAELGTHGGGPPGAASERDTKLLVVQSDMNQLIAYVESEANAHPEVGVALIEGVGLYVIKAKIPPKPDLAAKYTKVPGGAKVEAKARKGRTAYHWQMSTNQTTWSDLPETVVAYTEVDGLTPATIYYFRLRTVGVDGLSDWSAPISFIAH
jgi:hypothetical protein